MAKKEVLGAKKVVLLKNGDRTCGQKELPWGHELWPIIYFQAGRGSGIAKVSKAFWKQGFQDVKEAS